MTNVRTWMIMGYFAAAFAAGCGDGAYGPGGNNTNPGTDAAVTPPEDMREPADNGPTRMCAENATQECVCPGGGRSSQTCNEAGTGWGQCQCQGFGPDAGMTPPPADNGPACTSGLDCTDRCSTGYTGRTTCANGIMGCTCTQNTPPPNDAGMTPPTDIGPLCGPGQTNCAGACVDLQSNASNCGTCGTACGPGNRCAAGHCVVDCGALSECSGACVNLSNNELNCGRCGNACVRANNANVACNGGSCNYTCMAGFIAADSNASHGCDINLATDVNNCGSRGHACPSSAPNGAFACVAGTCQLGCDSDHVDVDGNPANGCEVDLRSDVNNCGRRGNACPGGQMCCNRTCVNLSSDQQNCGRCGNACEGSSACVAGACTGTCSRGWLACGGGCYDGLISSSNCGACGNACVPAAHASATCSSGRCAFGACSTGFGDCDANQGNGCEVNLSSDPMNCGACGNRCPGPMGVAACSYGRCTLNCPAGFDDCDRNPANGCEINLNTDAANCYACGYACGTGERCNAGWCELACPAGQVACGSRCVDITSDPNNCGGCGYRFTCATGLNMATSCRSSTCIYTCNSGFADCNGSINGCETNVLSDASNCGGCGRACASGQTCVAGACTGGTTCTAPLITCSGACVDPRSDTNNCGACGNRCGAGQVCSGSACVTVASDAGAPADASDSGLMPGEHTLYIQNGSGVASATVTVGSISNVCRSTLMISTWNAYRGMRNSPPGGALDTPITPGRAHVKFYCGSAQIDLCAQYAAGRRNAADLLGSDAIVRVDGRTISLTNAPIARDLDGGGCMVSVSITEPDGSLAPGEAL